MNALLVATWIATATACGQPAEETVNPVRKAREIRLSDFEGTWDNLHPAHGLRVMTIRGHLRTPYDGAGNRLPSDYIDLATPGRMLVRPPPGQPITGIPPTHVFVYEFDDDGTLYMGMIWPGVDMPPGPSVMIFRRR
jgi:hypothetical protein